MIKDIDVEAIIAMDREKAYQAIRGVMMSSATVSDRIQDLEDLQRQFQVKRAAYVAEYKKNVADGNLSVSKVSYAKMDNATILAAHCGKIIAPMIASLPPRKPEIILEEVDLTEGLRETIQKYIDGIQNDVRSRKKGEKELKQLIIDLNSQKGTLVQKKENSYHDRLTFADKVIEFCQIQLAILSDPLAGIGEGVATTGAPKAKR